MLANHRYRLVNCQVVKYIYYNYIVCCIGWRRGPAAPLAVRVFPPGVSRDGHGSGLLLPQTERQPQRAAPALLLGAHQPRGRQYR